MINDSINALAADLHTEAIEIFDDAIFNRPAFGWIDPASLVCRRRCIRRVLTVKAKSLHRDVRASGVGGVNHITKATIRQASLGN